MTKQEIIDLIQRRKEACELALKDLYNLDNSEDVNREIIRVEAQIFAYECLLQDIF